MLLFRAFTGMPNVVSGRRDWWLEPILRLLPDLKDDMDFERGSITLGTRRAGIQCQRDFGAGVGPFANSSSVDRALGPEADLHWRPLRP